jgi:PKD repeat protein
MKHTIYAVILMSLLASCEPVRDDEFGLTGEAPKPVLEITPLDGNTFVVKDKTAGGFQRLWSFPGGMPANSTADTDTIFYPKKGSYTISLFVSQSDGSGTGSAIQKVEVAENAAQNCTDKMALLTGDCFPQGKCWTFTREAGAVKVGPKYDDFSWYTAPAGGLQDAQYDDGFCFTFDGLIFQNKNNGASVNPWDGYKVVPLDPGVASFVFSEGTGTAGKDQIIIPDDQFMGVMDADNIMDVMQLTETQLVVRTRLRAANGVPAAEGWFELTFVRQ